MTEETKSAPAPEGEESERKLDTPQEADSLIAEAMKSASGDRRESVDVEVDEQAPRLSEAVARLENEYEGLLEKYAKARKFTEHMQTRVERAEQAQQDAEASIQSEIESRLEEKKAELDAELEQWKDRYARLQADHENYRKRMQKEKADLFNYSQEDLCKALLPVLDNFERALSHRPTNQKESDAYIAGVEMINKLLVDALTNIGVKRVEADGQTFDPNVHEAMQAVETAEHPDQTVIQVLEPGYMLKHRLLRPARVVVSRLPEGAEPPAPEQQTPAVTESGDAEDSAPAPEQNTDDSAPSAPEAPTDGGQTPEQPEEPAPERREIPIDFDDDGEKRENGGNGAG